jgi:hypothetical protein
LLSKSGCKSGVGCKCSLSVAASAGFGCATRDLHGLVACGLILRAPSTFSGWASFTGRVSIFFLGNDNEKLMNFGQARVWKPRFY